MTKLQKSHLNRTQEIENSQNSDDQMLVQSVLSGSNLAFEEIVRRHHQKVRTVVMRYLGPSMECDEISQDVFVQAFKSLSKYKGMGTLGAWLVGIAKNKILVHFRDKKRHQKLIQFGFETEIESWEKEEVGHAESDDLQHELTALQSCLKKLSAKHFHLVQWFYFENISAEKIAQKQKMKPSAIRMALMRIRKSLAKCIQRTHSLESQHDEIQ